jgi:hypothetical protein
MTRGVHSLMQNADDSYAIVDYLEEDDVTDVTEPTVTRPQTIGASRKTRPLG